MPHGLERDKYNIKQIFTVSVYYVCFYGPSAWVK